MPGRQDHRWGDQRAAARPGWDHAHARNIRIEHQQTNIRMSVPIRLPAGDGSRAAHQTQYKHQSKDRCKHNFLHVKLLFIANLESKKHGHTFTGLSRLHHLLLQKMAESKTSGKRSDVLIWKVM